MANREWVGLQLRPPNAVDGREQMEEVAEGNPLPVKVMTDAYRTNVHFRTFQIVIGTTANQVLPANPARLGALITQITGSQIAYLGPKTPTVTAANGAYLGATAGNSLLISTQDEVWGIAASSGQTVSVLEEYLG